MYDFILPLQFRGGLQAVSRGKEFARDWAVRGHCQVLLRVAGKFQSQTTGWAGGREGGGREGRRKGEREGGSWYSQPPFLSFPQNEEFSARNKDVERRIEELSYTLKKYEQPSGIKKVCSSTLSNLPSRSQLQQLEEEKKVAIMAWSSLRLLTLLPSTLSPSFLNAIIIFSSCWMDVFFSLC